jgi:hypothetical protein
MFVSILHLIGGLVNNGDAFFLCRISIHMLISHYQSLHGIQASVEGLVGTIDPECDILAVAEQAILLTPRAS